MYATFLKNAKESQNDIAFLNKFIKNKILKEMAQAILDNMDFILNENLKDIKLAKETNLERIPLERLYLRKDHIDNMAKVLLDISKLDEPLGKVLKSFKNENNLNIKQVSVPIGIIAVIYESRPNVTVDVAALCLKSGNVCILKGGKEANYSNKAIVSILHNVLEKNSLPKEIISFLNHGSREEISKLIKEKNFIDLILPRGGEDLNTYILENSLIPVIQQGRGLCHIYIHKDANIFKSLEIILNSKCQNPSVCNSVETLLIDESISEKILPLLYQKLKITFTELRGCKKTQQIIHTSLATEEDFNTEHLDNILNIKVVQNMEEALSHINIYSSKHSEAILTENNLVAEEFMNRVDSSCIYVNASTKFTEGETFGFGGEVGISTSKFHARGPIGINELTTYKYKIYGEGQIKVNWIGSFGYFELLFIILFTALVEFIPETLLMLPIGYLLALYNVPMFISMLLAVILFLFKEESKYKILEKIFFKYPKLSNIICSNIKGTEQFSSITSILGKMPKKGKLLYKLVNVSFWVSSLTFLGYEANLLLM